MTNSSLCYPEAKAVSERVNKSIKNTVSSLQKIGVSLKHALPLHCAIYNATIHPATKVSPNLAMFGRALPIITDAFKHSDTNAYLDVSHFISKILDTTKKVVKSTYHNLKEAQNLQNAKINAHTRARYFKVGDIAYLRPNKKFKRSYLGPYIITGVVSPVVV